MSEQIIETNFDDELKKSYLAYAMSVITDRALPDARDGLKPVQRRILHAMNELGLASSGTHKKSARIVGETMGKYHPHGDTAIYDAMARMAQPFSLRLPLVDGQGNFGSLDGDSPAAMRYTEAKMAVGGELMQADIGEKTVSFIPNFDESLTEPSVLPSLLPNLLINGSQGIAVGMATNIPPHNPVEILNLLSEYLGGGCKLTAEELADKLTGPDFPTGGEIMGRVGVRELYTTGRGRMTLRGRAFVEETKTRFNIVITEVPYGVPKERLVSQIAQELGKRNIDGIAAVRDESDRTGNRVVVEMFKRADPQAVLALLYSCTALSSTWSGNLLALVDGTPRTLTLKGMMDVYIDHRRAVVTARTAYRLERDRARLHIVEGLLKALDIMDAIIALIRKSKTVKDAREGLVSSFGFTVLQAEAILTLTLSRLTGLERDALVKEKKKLTISIAEYEGILSSRKKLDRVLEGEFKDVLALLSKEDGARRTTILDEESAEIKTKTGAGVSPGQMALSFEQIVPSVISVECGYIKKKDVKRRASEEDGLFVSGELAFAVGNDGRFYMREKKGIPDAGTRKQLSVNEFFGAGEDASLEIISPDVHNLVFFVTEDGSVKKMSFEGLKGDTSRKNTSRQVFPLKDGEKIFSVLPGKEECDILLTTAFGRTLRINESAFRDMGYGGRGVSGINIDPKDCLASARIIEKEDRDCFIFLVTETGGCARFPAQELKTSGRGGKGIYIHRGDKPSAGKIERILCLYEDDTLVFSEGKELPARSVAPREISTHSASSLCSLSEKTFFIRRGKKSIPNENENQSTEACEEE